MKIFLVGGAVRDDLLNLPVTERDWVVTGATEQQMVDRGFLRIDARFPVFTHHESGEEYALARRETKTGPGYKGFEVYAGPDVTLEEDLVRRDLTINALAQDAEGNIVDLFDGRADLDSGLLRHISPAFTEDPVRLLRIARFAAKLGPWGFRIAHSTHELMCRMAASDDLMTINRDRLWREMKRSLAEPQPWRFFEVLKRCGALDRLLPELAVELGPGSGHQAGGEPPGLEILKRATSASPDPAIRYAAVMAGVASAFGEVPGLPAERGFSGLLGRVVALDADYNRGLDGDAEGVLNVLIGSRASRDGGQLDALLLIWGLRRPEAAERAALLYEQARVVIGKIGSAALREAGLEGPALGEAIRRRQLAALRGVIAGS